MKKVILMLLVVVMVFGLAGCAASSNPLEDVADDEGDVAGFWRGLWHGIIAPVTFVLSLIFKTINVYEVFNSGGWYNFGFMLGLTISLGGSSGGAASRRKRRE